MAAEYMRALVTFIDVLGFRSIVNERSASEVDAILEVFSELNDEKNGEVPGLRTIAFSDSVVRVLDARHPSGLFYELLTLLHAQSRLIKKGVLVRGGVALGDIYVEGARVFGPALITAYDLESHFAVHPRIVVAPEVLRAFKEGQLPTVSGHSIDYETQFISRLLAQSEEGMWFIDYLRAFLSETDSNEEYVHWLSSHAELIRKAGSKLTTSVTSVAVKLNWMAKYHNSIVLGLAEEPLEEICPRDKLLIGPHEVPSLITL